MTRSEQIADKIIEHHDLHLNNFGCCILKDDNGIQVNLKYLLVEAIEQAIKEVLLKAAENAEYSITSGEWKINKQSITNTTL